ncbi:hypothetical protein SAICODRAFT_46808, partial [Saitoella complicata NRRL Y-17804]
ETRTDMANRTATSTTHFSTSVPTLIAYTDSTIVVTLTEMSTTLTTATQTATTTSWVTETIYPAPDLTCGNQGLEFAIQEHRYENTDASYSAFNVEDFKTVQPWYTGTTTFLGFENGDTYSYSLYGAPARNTDYIALNHRGYLFARQTGTYTFITPDSDDITIFWLGPQAFSGYTRQNANILQPYNFEGADSHVTAQIDLVEGQYYPFRILYGNGQGNAQFAFNVYAPDGSLIISRDTSKAASPYLVQFSCDGITAPTYPAFGFE